MRTAHLCAVCLGTWLVGGATWGQQPDPVDAASLLGRVFWDRDGDGQWSPGDEGIAGARLLTDSGLEILSDAAGRFHADLLRPGREIGAGRVVVLDRASLPAGARVPGSVRRLVELGPDQTGRLDFAVQPARPLSLAAPGLGAVAGGAPAMLEVQPDGRVETWLAASAPRDCAVRVDGHEVDREPDGSFRVRVTIEPGISAHLVTLACQDGRLELVASEIHWLSRPRGGDLVVPAAPRELAVCAGPPGPRIPQASSAELVCRLEADVDLQVAGRPGRLEGDRRHFRLPLQPGENRFSVTVRYGSQPPLAGWLGWQVDPVHWLGALYGGLAMGWGFGGQAGGVAFGGRLQGHLQASLPWDLKLILGGDFESFDTQGLSASGIVDRALRPRHDPARFERAPDPESAPLTSGDEARVIDFDPSASRYLLELQRKGSSLGWGGFTTDPGTSVSGTEAGAGRFHRKLVGAHASLRPLEDLFPGPEPKLDLGLSGFFVPDDADSRALAASPARDEFLATGGSLYFLGHRWLVEGSENLLVERRDLRTGMTLARRRLVRGVEYEVDWLSGRVLLTRPLDPGLLGGGAVRLTPAGATASVLVVEYEYLDPAGGGRVAGGQVRLAGRPTGPIELSGSFGAFDGQGAPDEDYRLLRGRLRVRIGRWAELWGGWADSQGRLLTPTYSVDGGLSRLAAGLPDRDSGEAYQAGAALHLGGLQGRLDFRRSLNGFSDSGWLSSGDLTQGLAVLRASLGAGLDLHGRASGTELLGGRLWEGLFGVGWRITKDIEISLEGSYDGAFPKEGRAAFEQAMGDGQRALAGLRAAWRLADWLTLVAGHQQSLWAEGSGRAGRDLTLTTAGAQLGLFGGLQADLEGGWGPEVGSLVRLGLAQDRPAGGAVFAYTTFSPDRGPLRRGALTAGQSGLTEQGWLVSSAQTLSQEAAGSLVGQRLGLEIPIGRPWRLMLAYERAELHDAGDGRKRLDLFPAPFFDRGAWLLAGPGRRNAVFGRLAYLGERFCLSAAAEYRLDEQLPLAFDDFMHPEGPTSHRQTVLRLAGRFQPLDELTLAARLAWAESFGAWADSQGPGVPEGGFLEASVGAAWRPARLDWLRLVLRASAGRDDRPPDTLVQEPGLGSLIWYRASLAVLFRPTRYFEPTLVVAPWLQELEASGAGEDRRLWGIIGMLRLGSEIWAGLGLAAELRLAAGRADFATYPEGQDDSLRLGAAAEVFYQIENEDLGGLRLSLGYSLSDIPDPLMSDLTTGRQGLFLRLEGML